MKGVFIERNGGLFPTDEDGREIVTAAGKRGSKGAMLDYHPARNPYHHRLMFYLMKMVIDGGAWDGSTDTLLQWLKIGCGHVETIIGPDGKTYYVPKSISFESLDQAAFTRFFERAVYLICSRLLKRDDWEALRDEVIAASEGQHAWRRAA